MRKIIQLESSGVANNSNTQCDMFLFALCDDGTVWVIDNYFKGWHQIQDIPQDINEVLSEG